MMSHSPQTTPQHAVPTAIILAAGVGRRLGPQTLGAPKVLLEFDGGSLLARHLTLLRQAGVANVTVVVGYEAGKIRSALPALSHGLEVHTIENPDFREGSVVSLWAARDLLLDRNIEPGDEPVKLCVKDGAIVDFRKKPTEAHDFYGESVGFFRFAPQTAAELADRADDYVTSGRRGMEYEEPIRDMIMQSAPDRFGFEDITGLPWTEIDFPEDVA